MKIIFACAGKQTRWNNYRNCHKHLIPINGIPLLKRNITLFNKFFNYDKYYVSINNENVKSIYNVDEKIIFYIPENIIDKEPPYKTLVPFLETADDDVLLLLGDVAFSEDCIKKIYNNTLQKSFKVFGRKKGSNITGCPWGELFAFYIPQSFIPNWLEAVNKTEYLYNDKKISRFSGWEIISYIYTLNKSNKNIHKDMNTIFMERLFPNSFIEINDETEDFDFPKDYDNYIKLLQKRY